MTKNIQISVRIADTPELRKTAFAIRKIVFVNEQGISAEDEFDAFEDHSRHFLAKGSNTENSIGTARWRKTEQGVKLERFCVLPQYRKLGVGSALLKAVLEDIHCRTNSERLYLHAQLDALPLYHKFGFLIEGDEYLECGIAHHTMILALENR